MGENREIVASFTLTSSQRWNDKAGDFQEDSAIMNCAFLGGWAEPSATPGKQDTVMVSERLRGEHCQKDGVTHSEPALICEGPRFVSLRQGARRPSHGEQPVPVPGGDERPSGGGRPQFRARRNGPQHILRHGRERTNGGER